MILDHGPGRFGELLRLALQMLSLRIEMPPAHMEARVVGGLRRLGAIAVAHAKCAVHASDEFDFHGTCRRNV